MAFQRGEVVLIPFPYTDLSATKTRPAVIVSSPAYHAVRPDLLLAYVSSQILVAVPPLDVLLQDWQQAGLLKPSFIRPKLAAIEPSLVVHQVGQLSLRDLTGIDRILRLALALTERSLAEITQTTDFMQQPPALVQAIAEKSITALKTLATSGDSAVDLDKVHKLFQLDTTTPD